MGMTLIIYPHPLSMDESVTSVRHLNSGKDYEAHHSEEFLGRIATQHRVASYEDYHSTKRNLQEGFQADMSQTETKQ